MGWKVAISKKENIGKMKLDSIFGLERAGINTYTLNVASTGYTAASHLKPHMSGVNYVYTDHKRTYLIYQYLDT